MSLGRTILEHVKPGAGVCWSRSAGAGALGGFPVESFVCVSLNVTPSGFQEEPWIPWICE